MSALMVRPEEEVTLWEGAAMVVSKALESGFLVHQFMLWYWCARRMGALPGSLILWRALLRTSRGPQSSWAPKEGCKAKRTWITSIGPSPLSAIALIAFYVVLYRVCVMLRLGDVVIGARGHSS
jgi:hypothetical protein